MAKKAIFVLLCCLILCGKQAMALSTEPFYKDSFLNLKSDLAEASQAGRMLMVIFEQDGCSYCLEMHRDTFADKEIVDIIQKNFDVVQLDLWGSREVTDLAGEAMTEKKLALKMGMHFSPMISFIGADGKEVFRITGHYKPTLFKLALSYVAEGAYKKTGFKMYTASHSATVGSSELATESFLSKETNLAALQKTASAKGKGIALLFEKPHCATCSELHEKSFSDRDVVKRLADAFEVVQIDAFGKRQMTHMSGARMSEAGLAEKLGIRYLPTIIFTDKDGKTMLTLDNYIHAAHFSALVTYLTTDLHKQYASFQYWLSARNAARRAAQQNPN